MVDSRKLLFDNDNPEGVHLKKEFRRGDVQRLRNIFSGKAGDSTTLQVGYTGDVAEHKEGDVWLENGKQWTIKNGIKQTYTKLDSVKKLLSIPVMCPSCNTKMKHPLDKKMYTIHKKCLNCVQSYETQLKLEGKYEEYVKSFTTANAKAFISEARDFIKDVSTQKNQFVLESGQIEDHGGEEATKKVLDTMLKELEDFEQKLEQS